MWVINYELTFVQVRIQNFLPEGVSERLFSLLIGSVACKIYNVNLNMFEFSKRGASRPPDPIPFGSRMHDLLLLNKLRVVDFNKKGS